MSIHPAEEQFANWDLADRMTKSLRVSGMKVQDMAEYLGVSRGSVGNWINGRVVPSTPVLKLWALRTGAPYEWLLTGSTEHKISGGPLGGAAAKKSFLSESNRRPFHYKDHEAQIVPFPERPAPAVTEHNHEAAIINFPGGTAA